MICEWDRRQWSEFKWEKRRWGYEILLACLLSGPTSVSTFKYIAEAGLSFFFSLGFVLWFCFENVIKSKGKWQQKGRPIRGIALAVDHSKSGWFPFDATQSHSKIHTRVRPITCCCCCCCSWDPSHKPTIKCCRFFFLRFIRSTIHEQIQPSQSAPSELINWEN